MPKLFTVRITRKEEYHLPITVEATSEEEAIQMAKEKEENDEYSAFWNELQPFVETKYEAHEGKEMISFGYISYKKKGNQQ